MEQVPTASSHPPLCAGPPLPPSGFFEREEQPASFTSLLPGAVGCQNNLRASSFQSETIPDVGGVSKPQDTQSEWRLDSGVSLFSSHLSSFI